MATNQGTTATNIPPAASELASELQTTLGSADTLSAQRVQSLQLVHQARLSRLNRELAALQAQKAPDGDVKAAEAAVAAGTYTAARVAVVQQQMATTSPQPSQNGWVLQGRVFDSNLKPLSAFTVYLVDAQNNYQNKYGFAFTDDTGLFLLNFSGGQPSTKQQATTQQGATTPPLFLEIADTQAQIVYLSQTAFEPVAGSTAYQNVTLPSGSPSIGDPPQEIRDVAMPPGKKKKTAPQGPRK
jgi:hypothetical protein